MQPQDMTPIQLCKAIDQRLFALSHDEAMAIKRTYAVTWSIVNLNSLNLAKPTKDAQARLLDLYLTCHRPAATPIRSEKMGGKD